MVENAWRFATSRSAIGFADQIVLSIVNFLTMLIVARSTSAQELGYFALATSITLIAIGLSDSLVTRPYAVRVLKSNSQPAVHAGSALALGAGVAVVVALISALGAIMLGGDATRAILANAAALPFLLLREFARRHALANLDYMSALRFSVTSGLATILSYLLLVKVWHLSAPAAILLQGLGALLAAVSWWQYKRENFTFQRQAITQNLSESWSLSRWFLIGQTALQFGGLVNHWVSAYFMGAAATGGYVAALSIIALTNPVVFGIFNITMPRSVHMLHGGGMKALRRQVWRDASVMSLIVSVITVALVALGPFLFHLLYGDLEFEGNNSLRHMIAVLGLATVFGVASGIILIGLQSAERAKQAAFAEIGMLISGVIASSLLIVKFGLVGAAYGRLFSEIVVLAVCGWIFLKIPPDTEVHDEGE